MVVLIRVLASLYLHAHPFANVFGIRISLILDFLCNLYEIYQHTITNEIFGTK